MMTEISQLAERVVQLEQRIAKLEGKPKATQSTSADLDGKYGDPVVRKDPPRWDGPSYEGKHFSECPPEYLSNLAGFLLWRAEKEEANPEKAKYAKYSRQDAARAEGWAMRNEGKGQPVIDTDDLPF